MQITHKNPEKMLNAAIQAAPKKYQNNQKSIDKHNKIHADYQAYLALTKAEDIECETLADYCDDLYTQACEINQFDVFLGCVSQLKRNYPEFFKNRGKFPLYHSVSAKLRQGEIQAACDDFIEFCDLFGRDLDLFRVLMYQLLYHGQHEAVLQGIEILWPVAKKEAKDAGFFYGITSLKLKYCQLVCFHSFLDTHGTITQDELLKKIAFCDLNDIKALKELGDQNSYLGIFRLLSEKKPIDLLHIELDIPTLLQQSTHQLSDTIYKVIDAFMWYLLDNQNIPNRKILYYWLEVSDYIIERMSGELKIEQADISHLFRPEPETINCYIQDHFILFAWFKPYEALMFQKGLLLWIDFLAEHQLISDPANTLKNLSETFIDLYNAICPENAPPQLKADAKNLLIHIKDAITKYETTHAKTA